MEQIIIRTNFEYIYQKSIKLAINEYIRDLLLFNERVIFPGFGALEIVKKPAKISGAKIAPPVSVIIFNHELKRDDGFLSAKISQAEEIDESEAREKVLEFVDSIVFAFNKGEQFEIEGVCTLFQDEDNNVRVTRDAGLNLDFDSFGLGTLEIEPFDEEEPLISSEEIPPVVESLVEKVPVEEKTEAGSEEITPEEETSEGEAVGENEDQGSFSAEGAGIPPAETEPDEYDHDGGGKSNKNTIWILSGAIVVVLTALVIMTLKTGMLDGSFNPGSLFNSSDSTMEINDNIPAVSGEDSEFDTMVNEMENNIDSTTSIENAMNPQEKKVPLEKPTEAAFKEYHIIAGSFKDRKNAEDLQQELTMKGFQTMLLERGDGYFRVSAGSYSNKETALSKLNDFKKVKGMNNAWVMNLH